MAWGQEWHTGMSNLPRFDSVPKYRSQMPLYYNLTDDEQMLMEDDETYFFAKLNHLLNSVTLKRSNTCRKNEILNKKPNKLQSMQSVKNKE